MSFEIRSEIVAVLAERGGKFAAPMLDAVGVFDPVEMEDAWPHDGVWISMYMDIRDFHSAIVRRSPISYVVPTQKQFLAIRSVAELLTSLVAQSHFVDIDRKQEAGDEAVVKMLINMVSQPEYDRNTVIGFLIAYSKVFGESNLLLRQLELAQCRRNVSGEEVLDIFWTHSSARMSTVVTLAKASAVGGA
ncbi:hypothetical protein [Candidatus Poseidonia alphae]|uniref:hypothetical protein n=1 Tax=Candidatus Poseidonia alphae TaxID=1915863 RepID=UPI0030C6BD07